jgi:hypothetical protein
MKAKTTGWVGVVPGALLAALLAGAARGADGVIEINQQRAAAGEVTAGDGPGFPVTLSEAGSYRLTGDLTVASETEDAIEITADHVTVDLAGFVVSGPATPNVTNEGISMSGRTNVEIREGTLRGFVYGIRDSSSEARGHRVIGVRVLDNRYYGIYFGGHSNLVRDSLMAGSQRDGVYAGYASTLLRNTAHGNGQTGIDAGVGSTLIGNVAYDNNGAGIYAGPGCTLSRNAAFRNASGGIWAGSYFTGASALHANAAYENGATGIGTSAGSALTANSVYDNGGPGISAGPGCAVSGNHVYSNGGDGVVLTYRGVAVGNTAASNSGYGLNADPADPLPVRFGYAVNVVSGNTAGEVRGGIEIGDNLCGNDTSCP